MTHEDYDYIVHLRWLLCVHVHGLRLCFTPTQYKNYHLTFSLLYFPHCSQAVSVIIFVLGLCCN